MKNKQLLQNFNITRTDSRLTIEWSNREIPKSGCLSVFMALFWLIWTPVTLFVTCLLFFGDGPKLFFVIWLLFGYLGVLLIPIWWSLRWARESVEFNQKSYKHRLIGYPKWFQRDWEIEQLTLIHYGHYDDEESFPMLSVIKGKTRDIIACWASPDITYELFKVIKAFLESNQFDVSVVDENKGQVRETRDNKTMHA